MANFMGGSAPAMANQILEGYFLLNQNSLKGYTPGDLNLLKQGQVLLAGPFTGGGAYTGLFVMNAGSREAAEALIKEDPTVKTNRAAYEVHGWWVARGVVD